MVRFRKLKVNRHYWLMLLLTILNIDFQSHSTWTISHLSFISKGMV